MALRLSVSGVFLDSIPRSIGSSLWAISLPVPSLLSDLWDSVLRAAPKKKTSHMKRRHRQLAGKALKDVQGLSKCPACGQIKRSHVLCPHCVKEIKESWKSAQTA